jgi:hypothetical protein
MTRWSRTFTATILLGLLVLTVLLLGTVYVRGPARWNAMLADLRAAGEPVTFADLEERATPIADEDNTALRLQELEAILEHVQQWPGLAGMIQPLGTFEQVPEWPVPFSAQRIAESDAFVSAHSALFEELARIEPGSRGRPSMPPFTIDTWAAQDRTAWRSAARLLALAAGVDMQTGRPDQAVQRVQTIFSVSFALHEPADLVTGLTSMANDALAVDALERVLRYHHPADEQLRGLQDTVQAREQQDLLWWMLRGERAVIVEMARCLAESDSLDGITPTMNVFRHVPWLIKLELSHCLERYHRLIVTEAEPLSTLLARAKRLDNEPLPRYAMLSNILLFSLERSIELAMRTKAELRCAFVALGCERFRLARGSWPQQLDELVPEFIPAVPADPFTDSALMYRRLPDRIVVYSVGENSLDDGGEVDFRPKKGPDQGGRPDAGFRLLNPELRAAALARVTEIDDSRTGDEDTGVDPPAPDELETSRQHYLVALADLYVEHGRAEAAEPIYRQALERAQRDPHPDRPSAREMTCALGWTLLELERLDEAAELAADCHRATGAGEDADDFAIEEARSLLEELLDAMRTEAAEQAGAGELVKSRTVLERARSLGEERLGHDHPLTAEVVRDLAELTAQE